MLYAFIAISAHNSAQNDIKLNSDRAKNSLLDGLGICQVSFVTCHVSCVACHMSSVTCHLSLTLKPTATAIDSPPANSPSMQSRLVCKYPKNKTKYQNEKIN